MILFVQLFFYFLKGSQTRINAEVLSSRTLNVKTSARPLQSWWLKGTVGTDVPSNHNTSSRSTLSASPDTTLKQKKQFKRNKLQIVRKCFSLTLKGNSSNKTGVLIRRSCSSCWNCCLHVGPPTNPCDNRVGPQKTGLFFTRSTFRQLPKFYDTQRLHAVPRMSCLYGWNMRRLLTYLPH